MLQLLARLPLHIAASWQLQLTTGNSDVPGL
jgi:hypothetical protein